MSNRAVFAGVIIICAALNTWYLYGDELLLFSDASQHALTRSPRVPVNLKIAIVSVLDVGSSRAKYSTAMASMECYALRHNYTYLVANGEDYRSNCKHKDITFQRHCIVAILLSSFDWILFVDADIGVVNEKVRIEEFLDMKKDLIFYNRFFNHEIMAGSYAVRRSEFSKSFLRGWADHEFSLPRGQHGRDQGALHMWLVKRFAPQSHISKICQLLWNTSVDYGTLSIFTVCCREVLKTANLSNLFVFDKGKGWARDSWLTNSHWNAEVDFMFHARKEADKIKYEPKDVGKLTGPEYFPWFDTLRTPVQLSNCANASLNWKHDTSLVVSKYALLSHLQAKKRNVDSQYQLTVRQLKKKFGDFQQRRSSSKEDFHVA